MDKFTISQLKSAWEFCYNEDLEKEYSGFVNLLNLLENICMIEKRGKS
jgi:hypothetical protein